MGSDVVLNTKYGFRAHNEFTAIYGKGGTNTLSWLLAYNSDKGWGRFQSEQICRLKIRRMKEERAKDLVVRPWCISEVIKAHEDCPELQAVLEEYHKPVVIQDHLPWTRRIP